MKNIVKTFGFIGVMSIISGVLAAENSRIGIVTNKTASRVPVTRRTSATNSVADLLPKTDSYYTNAECVEKYTDCIKADDACGPDMEECTTRVLFHAQMPKCVSVLSLCTDNDVKGLFGAYKNSLSAGVKYEDSKNTESAILDFTYPSDSSVLGQMILGAKVANQLDDSQCMKKYTSCIKKDNVCGEDFELCTDKKSFKKQAIACNSTLARCKNTAKKELFGKEVKDVTISGSNLDPTDGSVLGQSIKDGAELAAANAVSTCYKIADQCIIGVCTKSPFACIAGTTLEVTDSAENAAPQKDSLVSFARTLSKDAKNALEMTVDNRYGAAGIAGGTGMLLSARDVRSFINSHCGDVIGSNKYCYSTTTGRQATDKKLQDPDVRDEVFEDIYNARMGSDTKAGFVKPRLQQIADDFDKEAKQKCSETISSCVMRSCGGGIGSVCYTEVFHSDTDEGTTINKSKLYEGIKRACAPIVNTDANCQYAKAKANSNSYTYNYVDADVFTTLFPEYKANESKDPIGVVASLNARLSSSYNEASIAQMKKQCRNVVESCVSSMCGKDYVKCYRNRTDIKATSASLTTEGANDGNSYGTYKTGADSVDKSMNYAGGLLDYNIVIGLCMDTVRDADVCEEHLKVAAAQWLRSEQQDKSSWKRAEWEDGKSYASVRDAWVDANTTQKKGDGTTVKDYEIVVGYKTATKDTNDPCYGRQVSGADMKNFKDADECKYTEAVFQSYDEYAMENVGTSLFQDILKNVERNVQAKYNAKLTQEHNICLANNNGGIRGANDNGSSFLWVKLNKKVPGNYAIKGLSTKDFTSSNDLYGSFCRVRVSLMSDDKAVQDVLADAKTQNEAIAYFAVGDAFTCGSWLSQKTLDKITKAVGDRAAKEEGKGGAKDQMAYAWSTVGGFLAGGLGGYFGMDALQTNENSLGGLLGADTVHDAKYFEKSAKKCEDNFDQAKKYSDIAKSKQDSYDRSCQTINDTNRETCNKLAEERDNAKIQANSQLSSMRSRIREADKDGIDGLSFELKSNYEMPDIEKSKCDVVADGAEEKASKLTRSGKNLIAGAALGVAGAGLGAGITASVLEAKYQEISDEAVKAWMEEVGDHIKCYVGTEELGSYGDIVNFSID